MNQASFRWLTVQNETSSERLVIVDNEQNTALDGDFGFNFTTTLLNYNAETKKFSYVYDKTISCFVIRRKRDRELLKIEGYEEVAITSPDYLISPDKRIQWVYANYDYDYCFGFVLKQVPEAIKLRSMIIVKPRYDERTGDRLADEEIRADILQMTTRVKRVNPKTNLEEERINTIYLDCYQSLVQRQFGEFFQNNSLGEVCKAVLRPVYHDGTQVYLGMEATQGCVALKVIKGVAGNRITTMKDLEAVLQYELAIRNENVVEEIRAMSFLQSLNTPAERVLADIDSSASIAMSAFHTYEQLLCVDNKFFAITSNYAPDRCLLHYFETYYGGERPHRLSEDSTKHVLLQVVKAIHVIHQHGMVHHDLSTENILLRRISRHGRSSSSCAAADCSLPGNNCDPELFLQDMLCSLIDFGQSKAVPFDHISQSYRLMKPKLDRCVGKATFYCPELYQQGTEIEYDAFKVDVYQLGVLMFVLLFGMSPIPPRRQDSDADPLLVWFGILRDHQLGTMLVKWDIVNDQIMTKKVADCMSPMALDLLAALLSYDPRRRPSMEEVLHHPWFAGLPQSVLREVVPAMVSIPRPVHHYPISPPFLYPPSPFEAPAEVEEA